MVLVGENAAGVPILSEQQAPGHEQRRIAVIDGYRAVAILSVLCYHYTVRWAPPENSPGLLPAGKFFDGFIPFEYGWLGVEFFFVISGFVILMTLESCASVADFAVRRFARLWPAMAVAATFTTVVVFLLGPEDLATDRYNYLTSLLFIDPRISSPLLHRPTQWVDGAYWSLWVEVRFYILAAFIYLLVRKNFVIPWLAMLLTIPVSLFFSCFPLPSHIHGHMLIGLVQLFTPHIFIDYFPYFTLGICAYEIWSRGALRPWAIAGAVVTAIVILVSAAARLNMFGSSDPRVTIPANLLIFALIALFLIDHPLVSMFRVRPLVLVGQGSYSLYLLHQNIGVAVMRRCIQLGISYFVILPLTIVAMIGVSLLLFRWVEIPAKSWIMRHARQFILGLDRILPGLSYKSRIPIQMPGKTS